ncbi:serine/threonine-protein phosphatase with EF-hands 1 isoform X1 [Phasianus colchicus]|uniref:serine/threonine-protein phosphatase with EF-hands 1 isoform X1 n=1 Tax=Phasianus colchicus TaxID=9054 RepID=UPI00129DA8B1|nr:serine/threonine-protein phosphatase with EF-hands 1 isoform X1 [Phasianus colchicus]XP_031455214.1 serine/threonine-protein phosphatase with EF-hands 1 isoform X1 [Phasianus colchicus]XP_031455215.1 serine/threonine-protein phosphatase with EF-hands 1 isoform X1 [Phasianus colchicus]XP_031455216.1 serine/threonine-protein phosphatase with EF-hands 1 isoform X1 [Phasianus colchicus]XP_031455218.1 serine/threonine-protein phosphatase with EF-hands 1 isoform X1 [Phasianus colchicus]XP_0314552
MECTVSTMGCSSSADYSKHKYNETAIKATALIQRWYRCKRAQLEIRRRYSLTIFESIEYADEQEQTQLSNFFTFMLEHCVHRGEVARTSTSSHVSPGADSYVIEYEKIDVPDSYRGPRLSFPLNIAHAKALLNALKNQQLLHPRYVLQLLRETRRLLKEKPNITHVSVSYFKEITICGDLHGNLDDLLLVFHKNGLPSENNPYVFNGDFVDRGKNSMEILIILFVFLLIYPNDFHLNRGNHEDFILNMKYGFTKEVLKKYKVHGMTILYHLREIFSWLPLATVVNNKVLIVHGGISDTTDLDLLKLLERNKLKTLMKLPKLETDRKKQVKIQGISLDYAELFRWSSQPELTEEERKQVLDILWSDPKKQHGCTLNKRRGGGCCFGPDTTDQLLKKHNLKMLIRSHEFKPDGYDLAHDGKVITIFSASNYYEEGSNRGAYIRMNPDLVPHFIQYQVCVSTDKRKNWERVKTIEQSALQTLQKRIFIHKQKLMDTFAKYDCNSAGITISLSTHHHRENNFCTFMMAEGFCLLLCKAGGRQSLVGRVFSLTSADVC